MKAIRQTLMHSFLGLGIVCGNFVATARADLNCTPGWSVLGGGVRNVPPFSNGVYALTAFDDGGGPALYAAGAFSSIGGAPANNIAKWDGRRWSPLDDGLNGLALAMTVFDDGDGPALYAAGGFTRAGGQDAPLIAKWDGQTWSSVGNGPFQLLGGGSGPWIWALTVFDDGGGPALYAGGSFHRVGDAQVNHLAKLVNNEWQPVGGGVSASPEHFDCVFGLSAAQDANGGPLLIIGGGFAKAGNVSANNVAAWNGQQWSALGTGLRGPASVLPLVDSFARLSDGNTATLFAAGSFMTPRGLVAAWDGQTWTPLGANLTRGGSRSLVFSNALAVLDLGDGPQLYAGGNFTRDGDRVVRRVGRWNALGGQWEPLGAGLGLPADDQNWERWAETLFAFDDGATLGPALFAGGVFDAAGGRPASGIARWGCIRGDLNCDGQFDFYDIDAFLLALTDPDAHQAVYPHCTLQLADMNRDQAVDFDDLDRFIEALLGS